jgi:hypothetical protein
MSMIDFFITQKPKIFKSYQHVQKVLISYY